MTINSIDVKEERAKVKPKKTMISKEALIEDVSGIVTLEEIE